MGSGSVSLTACAYSASVNSFSASDEKTRLGVARNKPRLMRIVRLSCDAKLARGLAAKIMGVHLSEAIDALCCNLVSIILLINIVLYSSINYS